MIINPNEMELPNSMSYGGGGGGHIFGGGGGGGIDAKRIFQINIKFTMQVSAFLAIVSI